MNVNEVTETSAEKPPELRFGKLRDLSREVVNDDIVGKQGKSISAKYRRIQGLRKQLCIMNKADHIEGFIYLYSRNPKKASANVLFAGDHVSQFLKSEEGHLLAAYLKALPRVLNWPAGAIEKVNDVGKTMKERVKVHPNKASMSIDQVINTTKVVMQKRTHRKAPGSPTLCVKNAKTTKQYGKGNKKYGGSSSGTLKTPITAGSGSSGKVPKSGKNAAEILESDEDLPEIPDLANISDLDEDPAEIPETNEPPEIPDLANIPDPDNDPANTAELDEDPHGVTDIAYTSDSDKDPARIHESNEDLSEEPNKVESRVLEVDSGDSEAKISSDEDEDAFFSADEEGPSPTKIFQKQKVDLAMTKNKQSVPESSEQCEPESKRGGDKNVGKSTAVKKTFCHLRDDRVRITKKDDGSSYTLPCLIDYRKKGKLDWITCDACFGWFHFQCVKLEEKPKCGTFTCPRCDK